MVCRGASPGSQTHLAGLAGAPPHGGGGDARVVCASLQPVSEGLRSSTIDGLWWRPLEAPSQEGNVPPDPAILPGGTVVTHRRRRMLLCR